MSRILTTAELRLALNNSREASKLYSKLSAQLDMTDVIVPRAFETPEARIGLYQAKIAFERLAKLDEYEGFNLLNGVIDTLESKHNNMRASKAKSEIGRTLNLLHELRDDAWQVQAQNHAWDD